MSLTPQIYLIYANEDKKPVTEIYQRLTSAGFRPWMFTQDVRPGQDLAQASDEALQVSDVFLVFVSKNQ